MTYDPIVHAKYKMSIRVVSYTSGVIKIGFTGSFPQAMMSYLKKENRVEMLMQCVHKTGI